MRVLFALFPDVFKSEEYMSANKQLLSAAQVASSVPGKRTAEAVRRWIERGVRGEKLPATRIAGRIFVDRDALKHWLAKVNGGEPVPMVTK